MSNGPTVPPPHPDSLNTSLRRNIAALRDRRQQEEAAAPFQDRLARRITAFTGSLRFVYVHAFLYGLWIVANLGWIGLQPWDRSFVMLAMILSTFILISQNRMAAAAERRAELDLQVGLLAEHEITKLVQLVSAIAERLDVEGHSAGELEELKRTVAPEAVLDAIETTEAGGTL